ncbi:MAG: MTAP family purine nucleoside phosphorylase [Armatimonadota bacterium]
MSSKIAIIGGTGIDEMPEFAPNSYKCVDSKYGSVHLAEINISDKEIIILPRHGINHNILPNQINYRSQIAVLKSLNVEIIFGICAVGALKPNIKTGDFLILRDFIDFTHSRKNTFFDNQDDKIVHTDFSFPYCPLCSDILVRSCEKYNADFLDNITYVGVNGPRYETPAEVKMFAMLGGDVVGMTNIPEAILAKEAGICYAALAISTNPATGISKIQLDHNEVREIMMQKEKLLMNVLSEAVSLAHNINDCQCRKNWNIQI